MRTSAPGYRLVVDDFAALDWESSAVWHHLAGHRAQSDDVIMMGPPIEALALHLPEATIERIHAHRWMLRVVDAVGAVAAAAFRRRFVLRYHSRSQIHASTRTKVTGRSRSMPDVAL